LATEGESAGVSRIRNLTSITIEYCSLSLALPGQAEFENRKRRPAFGTPFLGKDRLLADAPTAVFVTEPHSRLTVIAVGDGITVIVTAAVAIIVGI
jgi:hypothetical protein